MKGGLATESGSANENILITKNITRDSHCGFGLGSENTKGLKNTVVYDNTFEKSRTGALYFKTPAGRGGSTEKVYIVKNTVTNPKDAISFNTQYDYTDITGKSKTAKEDKTKCLPDLHDIHISNLTVTGGALSETKNAFYI